MGGDNAGSSGRGESRAVRFVHALATGSTRRRGRWTPVGLTVFAVSLAAVVSGGLATDRLLSIPPLPGDPIWRGTGLALLLVGLGLCGWCVGLFVRARGTPVPVNPPRELVQGGPYAWVRNPMLTGVFAGLFGAGLLLRSPSMALVWIPAYVLLHVLELRWVEEPELERRFGVAYRAYRDVVPMFVPRPRARPPSRGGGRLRRIPPVCGLAAAAAAVAGTLRFRRAHVGRTVVMADARRFRVFRHLSLEQGRTSRGRPAILVVRFRFARGSERTNRRLSLLPVPAIAGYPGFRAKLWMSDPEGWWQGVYEWESREAIESYRGSLVFRTMERRAAVGTLSTAVIDSGSLDEWLEQRTGSAAAPGDERGTRAVAERTSPPTQRTIG